MRLPAGFSPACLIGHSHDVQTHFYRAVFLGYLLGHNKLGLPRATDFFYLGRGLFARDYLCTPGKVSVVQSVYCKCTA